MLSTMPLFLAAVNGFLHAACFRLAPTRHLALVETHHELSICDWTQPQCILELLHETLDGLSLHRQDRNRHRLNVRHIAGTTR